MPAAWSDALKTAVAAGKIPDIPQTTARPQTNPTYPSGVNPNSPEICSSTYKCRMDGDIWDAPTGYIGTAFDDGPSPSTPKLLDFLKEKNERVTHFEIGIYIRNLPDIFLQTFQQGDDIAVHTYSHPYLTALSNLDIVAQLGYTMAIIRNSTGGRLARYFRPPYGDSDRRVQAIAREIFGLQAILWNQDTEDWSLTTGGTTSQQIASSMNKWLTGPKTPGLIILEHELSDQSVQAFINAYPSMLSNGWKLSSVSQLGNSTTAYQNAASSTSDTVIKHGIVFDGSITGAASSSTPTSSGSSPSSPAPAAASSSHSQPSNAARKTHKPSILCSVVMLMVVFFVGHP